MDMTGDLEDDHRWQQLKRKHPSLSEVDETASTFLQWRRMLLSMLDQATTEAYVPVIRRRWDCSIVSSDTDDDMAAAREFSRNLHRSGFIACILQDIIPGENRLEVAERMMRGSTVTFLLCSAALRRDRGIARLSYQDQLIRCMQQMNSCGTKTVKIIPVIAGQTQLLYATNDTIIINNSSNDNTSTSSNNNRIKSRFASLSKKKQAPSCSPPSSSLSLSSSPNSANVVLFNRSRLMEEILPFGIRVFREIVLDDPARYMQEVEGGCITIEEQASVRRDYGIEEQKQLLDRTQRHEKLEVEAVAKALQLRHLRGANLHTISRQFSDLTIDHCGAEGRPSVPRGSTHHSTLAGEYLSAFHSQEDQAQQQIHVTNSSAITIGPTVHIHVQESSSL